MYLFNKIKKILGFNMFKHMTINLTGPICKCKQQDVKLQITSYYIKLICYTCHIELMIPIDVLDWKLVLDKEHPEKISQESTKDQI